MLPVSQLKMLAYISLVLIVFSTAKFCRAEVDQDTVVSEVRHKRGPTVGLFAYPRVGRSDPDMLEWGDMPMELSEEYDYPIRESKRQGLVPFPRVGRSGQNGGRQFWPMQQKRASNSGANSGMWFGPRLGKRVSRASSEIKGNELYTPRLGRDSGEFSNSRKFKDFERFFRLSLSSEN
ncbi:cardio acceleratory peptide 2b isoform X2 [Toxorhynchites rutilus septentrionalis]|uniref:cardio acceleratory peptide 2b isoform X2 n=1 Tax=Toxorhynchites rutilus septentrionalis TaxID=329112 RepID=UPI00247ADAD1|nr:cardio acceleratory peptide 2b isoform X2 [Toxorhynchites rutilus septentrionalis]